MTSHAGEYWSNFGEVELGTEAAMALKKALNVEED